MPRPTIALIAEFDPSFPPHVATQHAVAHSAAALAIKVDARWVSTEDIERASIATFDGLWIAPGSPYRNLDKTLEAIRFAREIGYGGVSVVARATGLARSTIHAGLRDLRTSRRQRVRAAERIRRAGGGRRPLTTSDPALLAALLTLIEPTTRGDPESPLRWTCKSTTQLASELTPIATPSFGISRV